MRVFVTGASGWIGSAVVTELLGAGHDVVGLARSESAAARVRDLGARVRRGDLIELDGLRAAASEADAVVHLGYHHDFSQMAQAAEIDAAAIAAFGDALAPSGGALVIASGVVTRADGAPATEDDRASEFPHARHANAMATLALADRGVRSVVVRFPPTVHGQGDHGFIATLTTVARDRGLAGYVGDGAGRWPAVGRVDAARLVRLAVESAPAGSVVHAVAEEGVATRAIAEAIGESIGVPSGSIDPADAAAHFGWIGGFFGLDAPMSSERTKTRYGWSPTGASLLDDIRAGYYASSGG